MSNPIRYRAYWMWTMLTLLSTAHSLWSSTQIPGPPQSRPWVIVGATLHPMSGPPIERGSLLFESGRIVSLGDHVEIPDDAGRIDGVGMHVYPALFCAGGQLGLVEINSIRATRDMTESGDINPNVKVQVAVNPDSELIPVTRANGVLLGLSVPIGGLIAGQSAVMQLDGWTWEDMTLKSSAGMHIKWPTIPKGRLGRDSEANEPRRGAGNDPLKRLDALFDQAEQYRRGQRQGAVDLRFASLSSVLDGTIPIIAHADTLAEIESAVAFAARRKLRLIIYGGYDAELCAPILRERNVGVIISAVYRLPLRRSDPFDAAYTLPERLRAAGVRYCIAAVDRFGASNLRNLPYHAATAVAFGLPHDEGLKAITLYPAEILGVADQVGSLEAGKNATFILTDGDPLETTTQVHQAFIQGRRTDLTNRHEQLWRKYQEKYRQLKAARDSARPQ